MIGGTLIRQLERVISDFDPLDANRYFLFGSAVREDRFRDIDLGVIGNAASGKPLPDLREELYESGIPYAVDVVDFDDADADFRTYVLENEPILWIR